MAASWAGRVLSHCHNVLHVHLEVTFCESVLPSLVSPVDSGPTLIQDDLISRPLTHTCKDPFPNNGRICRFWVDLSLGGSPSNPPHSPRGNFRVKPLRIRAIPITRSSVARSKSC